MGKGHVDQAADKPTLHLDSPLHRDNTPQFLLFFPSLIHARHNALH